MGYDPVLEALKKENLILRNKNKTLQDYIEQNNMIESAGFVRKSDSKKKELSLQLLLDNSSNIYIFLDVNCCFTFVSRSYLYKSNISSIDLIEGRTLKEVFINYATKDKDTLSDIVHEAMRSQIPLTFEKIIAFREGETPRRYSVNFNPMQSNEYSAGLLVLTDITLIRESIENAEAAKTTAEKASLAKSEFLSNMSHEIRTPLNAIIGMTNIARNTDSLEKKDYCLNKIDAASTHLLGVINDILDMSKIEASRFELSPVEFNFEKMLQKVVNVINYRIEEKQQNFIIKIDPKIPKLLVADDQRLTQVVANILSNAVKFTPQFGTIVLNTKFLGEDKGICELEISIQDNGIGISETQIKKLFNSFNQADSSTTRKYGGTGLGLAISKKIVETSGGKIWVSSTLGKGSKFTFTIKAGRGTEELSNKLKQGANWNNIRVLVVDDYKDVLDYFSDIALQIGLNCDVALNGLDALKLVKENGDYDLYFIDWKMPEMNGLELIEEINKVKRQNSIIVLISSGEYDDIEEEAKRIGVNKFLPKPLFPSTILDTISQCLGVENQVEAKELKRKIADSYDGYHLLLVEDVDVNKEIVFTLLEPTNLKVDWAENGVEAVNLFRRNHEKYDIIFMDVQMPEMDGYEATRKIRSLNLLEATIIPIIALTANVFKEDIEKCLASGMNDHIAKPIDFEEVLSKLKTYLPIKKKILEKQIKGM